MNKAEAIKYLEVKKAEIVSHKHTLFGCNGYDALCSACDALREQEQSEQKPMNNADRIRAMTDEELAEFLVHFSNGVKRWLQQPAGGADYEI